MHRGHDHNGINNWALSSTLLRFHCRRARLGVFFVINVTGFQWRWANRDFCCHADWKFPHSSMKGEEEGFFFSFNHIQTANELLKYSIFLHSPLKWLGPDKITPAHQIFWPLFKAIWKQVLYRQPKCGIKLIKVNEVISTGQRRTLVNN